jgi:hypothetical protein
MGLSVATGLASTATSWTRAKTFVKTANEEIFLPRGLRCKVLETRKMMAAVGHGSTILELPPPDRLEERDEWDKDKNAPRMRRVRALEALAAPLTFEGLPAPETPEN